jgi:hypothetical protein
MQKNLNSGASTFLKYYIIQRIKFEAYNFLMLAEDYFGFLARKSPINSRRALKRT